MAQMRPIRPPYGCFSALPAPQRASVLHSPGPPARFAHLLRRPAAPKGSSHPTIKPMLDLLLMIEILHDLMYQILENDGMAVYGIRQDLNLSHSRQLAKALNISLFGSGYEIMGSASPSWLA